MVQDLRLLKELQPLVETVEIHQLSTSFQGWFAFRDYNGQINPPPSWKQAFSVLFCLYPVVMLITLYVSPHLPQALAINILLGNIFSVILMNWWGMPLVNRLLRFWLQPIIPSKKINIAGILLIVLALLMMLSIFLRLFPQ